MSTNTVAVNRPARRPGRGQEVLASERRQIIESHLLEGFGPVALARKFGRSRDTVTKILASEDCQGLKRTLDDERKVEAKRMLERATKRAAENWISAMDVAAEKGRHEPAKDLLLHTKTIEPVAAQPADVGPRIIIGIQSLPGIPDIRPALPGIEEGADAPALAGEVLTEGARMTED